MAILLNDSFQSPSASRIHGFFVEINKALPGVTVMELLDTVGPNLDSEAIAAAVVRNRNSVQKCRASQDWKNGFEAKLAFARLLARAGQLEDALAICDELQDWPKGSTRIAKIIMRTKWLLCDPDKGESQS